MARLTPLFSMLTQSHSRRLLLSRNCYFYSPKHIVTGVAPTSAIRTLALTANSPDNDGSPSSSIVTSAIKLSTKARRKAAKKSPEGVLKQKLNNCSKEGDVVQALDLYDEARKVGVSLTLDHYNKLLYLCSVQTGDASVSSLGLDRGFDIFQQMLTDRIEPNEATFTNAARLAAAKEDPQMAFELLKQMKSVSIAPRLRSYGPALYGFCKKRDAEKAYQVDAHMIESGVMAEEPELSALLEVSVNANNADKVYEMLHRLRAVARQVSESTLQLIEDWFNSEYARKTGKKNWDVNGVREGIVRGGGGWHGQGWLGSGQWKVVRTHVDEDGMCLSCNEKLVSIDIDSKETENFAASLCKLACEKEAKAKFNHFEKWLEKHGPFDAVVDGANVGLANRQEFSFSQLNHVVQQLRQMSPSKRLPLIILHVNRVTGGPAQNPNNRRLIENWKKNGALYATPQGSNDDWYWLYAAVSCKCLLLTNDEMRDHLFQLLGSNFFPRWKEKHQVLGESEEQVARVEEEEIHHKAQHEQRKDLQAFGQRGAREGINSANWRRYWRRSGAAAPLSQPLAQKLAQKEEKCADHKGVAAHLRRYLRSCAGGAHLTSPCALKAIPDAFFRIFWPFSNPSTRRRAERKGELPRGSTWEQESISLWIVHHFQLVILFFPLLLL